MLHRLLFFVFLAMLSVRMAAQTTFPISTNGGVFTPKGNLHALVVLITFKDQPQSNPNFSNAASPLDQWDLSANEGFPTTTDPNRRELLSHFFVQSSDFEERFNAIDYNFSKEWAAVSGGNFRFTAELFADSTQRATLVEIDPSGASAWSQLNARALQRMKELHPQMDFSRFDRRANNPNFYFDNSDTLRHRPDKKVDYLIFIYRYHSSWAQQPVLGMNRWQGSGGGVAGVGGVGIEEFNGYRFPDGFMMMFNSGVFLHEIAHTLYNAPHLMGVNNTVGEYFYMPSGGWGFTSGTLQFFRGMNAWERWYIGFIDPVATIENAADAQARQRITLRDFQSTGDALRLKLPYTNDQYLWIEHHAGQHLLDQHPWQGRILGNDTIRDAATGAYAYVERVADSRKTIINALSNKCNGIKLLNAMGNYDYNLLTDRPLQKNAWGNELYTFQRGAANPLSGLNPWYNFRWDFNNDQKIDYNTNYNAAKQEQAPINLELLPDSSLVRFYNNFGSFDIDKNRGYYRRPSFGKGDVLSATSNPPLLNHPRYDDKKQSFEPLILHDWQVHFVDATETTTTVEIRREPLRIEENLRWAAPAIRLPNISGDSLADLAIASGRVLRLDRSGTVNRHTADPKHGFFSPTVFTVAQGSTIRLEKKSQWRIQAGSKVVWEAGCTLILDKKARLRVENGAECLLEGVRVVRAKGARIE